MDWLLLQAVDTLPTTIPPASSGGTITVIIAGILAVIGAIVTGAIQIINAMRSNTRTITSEQNLSRERGQSRDKKIQEIHLLVNSRLLVVLRLLATMTKKEADRTGLPEDISAYQDAVLELQRAQAATNTVELLHRQDLGLGPEEA